MLYSGSEEHTNWIAGNNTIDYVFVTNSDALADLQQYGYSNVSFLNETQQNVIANVLTSTTHATGINFELADNGEEAELYFYIADLNDAAAVQFPVFNYYLDVNNEVRETDLDSYIIFDSDYVNSEFSLGSYAYETILHEVGHFLGLAHPHEGDVLAEAFDHNSHTLMSYNDSGVYYTDYRPLDKVALEYLYGGDGIGGEFGVYSTVTLEPNVIA